MDNKKPIVVFDMFKADNIKKVVLGKAVGTLVTS
jgi:uridylate kinase